MISYRGTHGTSKKRAEDILAGGFKIDLTKPSLRGSGVYFWKDGPYANQLARGWFFFRKEKRDFSDNDIGVIIAGALSANEDEIVNHAQIQDGIARHTVKENRNLSSLSRRKKCGLYDLIISRLEGKINKKIKIFITEAAPPKSGGSEFYDLQLLGAPIVLVARTEDCIKEIKVIKEF